MPLSRPCRWYPSRSRVRRLGARAGRRQRRPHSGRGRPGRGVGARGSPGPAQWFAGRPATFGHRGHAR
eukprot:7371240-Lingulodinium_polyedra.AAC.1